MTLSSVIGALPLIASCFTLLPSVHSQQLPSNFAPSLNVVSLRGFIEENSDIGTTVRSGAARNSSVLQVLVSDEDLVAGGQSATYQYVLSGSGATIFAVDRFGNIYLNVEALDADPPQPSAYELSIEAREVNTTPLRSSRPVTLTIEILDQNDNEPQFDAHIYTARTSSTGGLRHLVSVRATDADGGVFGALTYRIVSVSSGAESNFLYDQDAGALLAVGTLADGQQYQVVLEATDGAGVSARAVIVVTAEATASGELPFPTPVPALPTASQPPLHFNAVVDESTAPNTVVVSLGGVIDVGTDSRFTLGAGNDDGRFRIDPRSGTVSTVRPFDRETMAAYRLLVQTRRDDGQLTDVATLSVDVIDVNDNAPTFLDSVPDRLIVDAGIPPLVIATIQVSDADADENGRVSLVISPPNQYFEMDDSGSLRTTAPLPTRPAEHRLTLVATDKGSPPLSSRAVIVVSVAGASAPSTGAPPVAAVTPEFVVGNYDVQVAETAGARTLVQVEATVDGERAADTEYVLIQGDPSLFGVDGGTGAVSLRGELDAERRSEHVIVVSTRQALESADQTGRRISATVTIRVLDANDMRPLFDRTAYFADVRADSPSGSRVVGVFATDLDLTQPNNLVTFQLLGVGGAEHFFSLDPTTGEITTNGDLTGLAGKQITLYVEARDGGSPSLSSSATVSVTLYGQPATTDSPPFTTPRPITLPPPPPPTRPPVTPPSLNNLRFSQQIYDITIAEAVRAPFFVKTLGVVNKPLDSRLILCSITSGNYGGAFSLTQDGGGNCELRTQAALDRETVAAYRLNVSVTSGERVGAATVRVAVSDVNDNRPVFAFDSRLAAYYAGLAPETPTFTDILRVQATDADERGNGDVRYRLDPLYADAEYFRIGQTSGDMQNVADLTLITQQKFVLRAQATDLPLSGRDAWTRATGADVFVFAVRDANIFTVNFDSLSAEESADLPLLVSLMQPYLNSCNLVLETKTRSAGRPGFFAINTQTNDICRSTQFRNVFSAESFSHIEQQAPQLRLRSIAPKVAFEDEQQVVVKLAGERRVGRWLPTHIALIALAALVAIGSIFGLFALCHFWKRYQKSKRYAAQMPSSMYYGSYPRYGTLMFAPSEKNYETQVLELTLPIDDKYGPNGRDYSLEESMYTVEQPGTIDHLSRAAKRTPLIIPPPDYPNNGNSQKSVL